MAIFNWEWGRNLAPREEQKIPLFKKRNTKFWSDSTVSTNTYAKVLLNGLPLDNFGFPFLSEEKDNKAHAPCPTIDTVSVTMPSVPYSCYHMGESSKFSKP